MAAPDRHRPPGPRTRGDVADRPAAAREPRRGDIADRPAATREPRRGDAADRPELPLGAAWQQVTHRLLGALDTELADLELTAAEVNALACFAGADSRTVRELVGATGQRPSTLTGVLDRLERRGLVERAANPSDRRSILIRLTPAGRTHAQHVAAAFAALEQRLPADDVRATLAAVDAALGEVV
jgi:DNA-binding MarR family transcriptional regulator